MWAKVAKFVDGACGARSGVDGCLCTRKEEVINVYFGPSDYICCGVRWTRSLCPANQSPQEDTPVKESVNVLLGRLIPSGW